MSNAPVWISRSPAETLRWGKALGGLLEPGDCIALIGELGAGKTAFAGGIGQGLQVTDPMRSPSYLLCCEHAGRARVLHLDAYFEARMSALLEEGLPDRFREAVVVVEWADHCPEAWPSDRLQIRLSAGPGAEERVFAAAATGPRSAALLQAWRRGTEPGPGEQR
jgi:tRNA threonylcarbamoyladenosine biosynthesis protein TsaE